MVSSIRSSVLTIAGSDSGGCAGVQADLKTIAALGLHGVSAITAATAQTMQRVTSVHVLPASSVAAQIDAAFADFRVTAVKIGMLASGPIVDIVADRLRRRGAPNVVLDPVLIASSGTPLLPRRALALLQRRLLPLADVLTPNVPEAEILLGRRLRRADLPQAARDLLATGARAVLLKGGHVRGTIVRDVLADACSTVEFVHARLPVAARGTGCTLATAIAAGLASGLVLIDAVRHAEDFLQAALRASYRPARVPRRALDAFAAGRKTRRSLRNEGS